MAGRHTTFYNYIKQQKTLNVFSQRVQSQSHKSAHLTSYNCCYEHKTTSLPSNAMPIHVYSHQNTSLLHEPRKVTASRSPESDELSFSYRQLQMRVSKYNEFNRRNFQDNPQTKRSLYIKNIRKCKSDLMRFQLQAAIQSMVAKKEVSTKNTSYRKTPELLAAIKQKIEDVPKIKRRVDQATTRGATKSQVRDGQSKIISLQSPSLHFQGIKFKKSGLAKRKRRQVLAESSFEVRPWEETRKLATEPPQRVGNVRSGLQYGQGY